MMKNQNLKVKIQKYRREAALLLSLLAAFSLINPVYAAVTEVTKSPTISSAASPSGELRKKLKALEDEIASKASQLKLEIGQKLQNKVFLGTIISKTDTSLLLGIGGNSKTVSLKNYTQYFDKGKINLEVIKQSDYVAILGDFDENSVLTAKRLYKLTPPEKIKLQTSIGDVISLEKPKVTIKDKDGQTLIFTTFPGTDFYDGNKTSTITAVKVGKKVAILGEISKTGSLTARLVYLFPDTGVTATPSASPSANLKKITPTASPSGKLKK